jgi:hypothetical protein
MLRVAVIFVVGAMALALGSGAFAQNGILLTDLSAPRGLNPAGSDVLVADQGNGRILRVTPLGTVGVVVDGIPFSIFAEEGTEEILGVSSAIDVGGTYYYVLGEADEPGFDSVYSVVPGQQPVLIADLGAYEEANNTDGDVDEAGEPELLSNPFDLISDGAGGLYVSASGANAVLHIGPDGTISPFAIFPNRANPMFPAVGGPTMDQVPTGIEVGPDGAVYVATITGFPFPPEAARVYRLEDLNADGDALDDGETTTYAEGLTFATNIAFDQDGSLLVTEFSVDALSEAPGRLVRVVDGAISEVVADPLITPTGVIVTDSGEILVSMEFAGIVADVATAQMISSSPPPGEDGGITPPSTGDGGLAVGGGAPTLVGFGLLGFAFVVASGWLARRRLAGRA